MTTDSIFTMLRIWVYPVSPPPFLAWIRNMFHLLLKPNLFWFQTLSMNQSPWTQLFTMFCLFLRLLLPKISIKYHSHTTLLFCLLLIIIQVRCQMKVLIVKINNCCWHDQRCLTVMLTLMVHFALKTRSPERGLHQSEENTVCSLDLKMIPRKYHIGQCLRSKLTSKENLKS